MESQRTACDYTYIASIKFLTPVCRCISAEYLPFIRDMRQMNSYSSNGRSISSEPWRYLFIFRKVLIDLKSMKK